MKRTTLINTVLRGFITAAILLTALFLSACNKDSGTDPGATLSEQTTPSADAAESVASAVGEDDGGVTDQVGDLMNMASTDGFSSLAKSSEFENVEAEYDSINGIWTITIVRERGNPNGIPYAFISRVYTVQFLNAAGQPQKRWITDSDTARTINFDIVSGSGRHKTHRLSQQLKNLEGSFVASNANLPNLTVNGTYTRSAADTITTRNAVRTNDHTLELQIIDLVGPRGSRRDLSRKISGTITGTYTATVTFTKGDLYRETNIERNINIVIGGGRAAIDVSGETFTGDVQTGEIID